MNSSAHTEAQMIAAVKQMKALRAVKGLRSTLLLRPFHFLFFRIWVHAACAFALAVPVAL
jgi:hypothetical protein